MGIVNVTPDSFSDGGRLTGVQAAVAHCEQLLADGADILDIGGESSRPGAQSVPLQAELDRVMPVLEAALKMGCPVSIDTCKPAVMRAVLEQGADIINDIGALNAPGAVDAVRTHPTCGICLMHMRGEPDSMQDRPSYTDVVAEVSSFLKRRVEVLQALGVAPERIVLDPGIGFGKSVEHNLDLLRRQKELLAMGQPLLVGWSRKSTLGAITGRPVAERSGGEPGSSLGIGAERRSDHSCARCRSNRRCVEGVAFRRTLPVTISALEERTS